MARRKKPIWQSKIVWLQIVSVALEIAVLFNDSPFMKPETRAGMALGISMLTIIFRQLSNGEALTLTPVKD
jgi:hypothetical protein